MISIGIHIQEHSLNVAEVSQKGQVLKTYAIPLAPYQVLAQKQIQVIEELEKLQKKYQKETVRFCFALPQNETSYISTLLPFKDKFKLIKTLPFEIEDRSPFQAENLFFDSRVSIKEKQGKNHILCFLAPKETVEDFLQLIKKAKIHPYLLSTDGVALATLLEDLSVNSEGKTTTYLYLGWEESLCLFFNQGVLESLIPFNWGYKPIVTKMEVTYKLTTEEAKKQFAEKSFLLTDTQGFTKEQTFFSSLVKKEITPLIEKLKFLQLSIETKTELKFENIYFLGPGSIIKNLPSFFSKEFSLPFYRLKKISQQAEPLESFSHYSHSVALGLAFEGLKKPPYSGLNFLRSLGEKKFFLLQKKGRQFLINLGLLFLILTTYSLIKNKESKNLADQIHDIFTSYSEKIALLKYSDISVESVQKFLHKKETKQKNYKLLKNKLNQVNALDHLKSISFILKNNPSWDLKITSLKIKNQKVSINGQIKEPFLENLKTKLKTIAKDSLIKTKQETKQKQGAFPPSVKKEEGKSEEAFFSDYLSFSYQFQIRSEIK